ncbi:MAG: GH1 family beta-glucosidase [Verrucomicrobia bacterium]|nr:GH1 family beta-glucosidase [Verrucomicrobiota bacterium]
MKPGISAAQFVKIRDVLLFWINVIDMKTEQQAFQFPPDFAWGTASSSYQVEGAIDAAGRTPSVWDRFCNQPGNIADGSSGDRACDHFHRYKEDVALMKETGLNAYRFSISWNRIFPELGSKPNQAGLDFYGRLVDELLANDIQPYATLFHWDLPQWLEDHIGGWRSREIADYFAEYASTIGSALGDRVKHFFTINEFLCFTDLGYKTGQFAPGLKCDLRTVNQVRHNAMLAHGKGVLALRDACPSECKVGLAENISTTIPVSETNEYIQAAKKAYLDKYSFFIRVILEGKYRNKYLEQPDAPTIENGDMETISSPLDFVGINSYSPVRIKAIGSEPGWESISDQDGKPAANSPWHQMGPEVIYWGPRWLNEIWGVKEIVISENGCYDSLMPNELGEVLDHDRVRYLQEHLKAAERAIQEGYPLKGYFAWSLMDNFEWTEGYEKRFGLYFVDFESQKRIPKLSAQFYKDYILKNQVVGSDNNLS